MTGSEMIRNALGKLGYNDSLNNVGLSNRLMGRQLDILNQVYIELLVLTKAKDIKPLESVNDELQLTAEILYDCMPYGVAAFIAQSEGDADNQQIFISLYMQKKNRLNKTETIEDVIPV